MASTEKQRLLQRFEYLKTQRNTFEPEWKEITDYIQPRRGRYNITENNNKNRTYSKIINSRGTIASRTLASGLMSGLTSPARPWFKLGTPDPDMMGDKRVQEWLRLLEKLMIQVFASSNLYQVLPSVYMEMGLFGTACMTHFDDDQHVARFYPHTVGSYVLAQSDRLVVDTMGRELTMTVRQLVEKFGLDNVSDHVRTSYNLDNMEHEVEVYQFIGPNPGHVPGSPLSTELPYASVYCERGISGAQYTAYAMGDNYLGRSGFHELPFYAPRWDTTEADVYGTMSPGMAALGDVKALQELEKQKAIAVAKQVNPPLKGPSSLKNVPISSTPGGVTLYDGDAQREGLAPVYDVAPDIRFLEETLKAHEARIDEAFYADLFRQLANLHGVQPRNELELLQREQEKLLQLGPLLERVQGDLLDPLIDRTANQIFRTGAMPQPPEELNGIRLKVTYISPLAVAQRQAATGTIDRMIGVVGGLAQFDPSVVDTFSADEAVREYQTLLDAPAKILRDVEEVEAIRQARAEAAQAAQQAELRSMDAGAQKDYSQAEGVDK